MKKCRGSRLLSLSLGHIPGGLDIIGVDVLHAPRSVKQHLVSSQHVRESKRMTAKFVLTDLPRDSETGGADSAEAELSFWLPQLNRIPLRAVQASKPAVRVALLVNLN